MAERFLVEVGPRPPRLKRGWVRFHAWGGIQAYQDQRPAVPVALQVAHVTSVLTVGECPDLTEISLVDSTWYVAMDLDDVLRVMEVLT